MGQGKRRKSACFRPFHYHFHPFFPSNGNSFHFNSTQSHKLNDQPSQKLQYIPLLHATTTSCCGDLEATPAMLYGGSQQHFGGDPVLCCIQSGPH